VSRLNAVYYAIGKFLKQRISQPQTSVDVISITFFNNEIHPQFQRVPLDSVFVRQFERQQHVEPDGGTDFNVALTAAYSLISSNSASCKTCVLFLTDGESQSDPSHPLKQMKEMNQDITLQWIMYGNNQSGEAQLKSYCNILGTFSKVVNVSELVSNFQSFGIR